MTTSTVLFKLRIAFSILCGLGCMGLIALWVRSYHFDKTMGLHGEQLQYITHGRSHTVGRNWGPCMCA